MFQFSILPTQNLCFQLIFEISFQTKRKPSVLNISPHIFRKIACFSSFRSGHTALDSTALFLYNKFTIDWLLAQNLCNRFGQNMMFCRFQVLPVSTRDTLSKVHYLIVSFLALEASKIYWFTAWKQNWRKLCFKRLVTCSSAN